MKPSRLLDRLTPFQDFLICSLLVLIVKVAFHTDQIREFGVVRGALPYLLSAVSYGAFFAFIRRPLLRSLSRDGERRSNHEKKE